MPRSPAIHHCTSQPLRFFGRRDELAILDTALAGGSTSVAAFVGPGGQGKTAIVQHWLQSRAGLRDVEGLFLWSFYRGKDSDLCLRELFAYAEGMDAPPEVSASFCVDRLVPRLRSERWAIVLDGAEVVQHEQGAWRGRFVHPELGRLLETLAEASMPGVVAITTRFELPTLASRRHARLLSLGTLDLDSGVSLLTTLGVHGSPEQLRNAAQAAGGHAKAVELLGTWLARFHQGRAGDHDLLPSLRLGAGSEEERHVLRVLEAFHDVLPQELKDVLALTNAFRQPPTEACVTQYLQSEPVRRLLHETWKRGYVPFAERSSAWLNDQIERLIDLRLLERVSLSLQRPTEASAFVLDAHPLVRRGFEDVLGGESADALARAGFLRGRPDRTTPASLAEAREDVELFHAYCDAGLWSEADATLRGLDNPKHRFLAPAFERDLLLRFFPGGDWRQPPLWSGFGRSRSLAICAEMLGQFDEALMLYSPADAPLRGDALLALGRLEPILNRPHVPHPWQPLWQAYRAHALCLAGRTDEALELARSAIPLDIYEWVHIFEALLRLDQLDSLDLGSLASNAHAADSKWTVLARRRLQADHRRRTRSASGPDLRAELRALIEEYDRAGLSWERALTRLSYARLLVDCGDREEAFAVNQRAAEISRRYGMVILEVDALAIGAELNAPPATDDLIEMRKKIGFAGPTRP